MAADLTADEKVFIARMAPHLERGLSLEDAARAVLDDDARIYTAVFAERGGEYLGGNFTAGRSTSHQANPIRRALARHIYARIHARAALEGDPK